MTRPTKSEKMTPNDEKVLRCLVNREDYDGYNFLYFRTIQKATKLDRKHVRLSCRRLARKGLAEYGRGLWTDDGEVAGAGYAATASGRAALSRKDGK